MCREVIKFWQHETAKQLLFSKSTGWGDALDIHKCISFDLWKLRIGLEGLQNFKGVLACM